MALEEYKKKRKFKKTPEPKPKVKKTGLSRFVVQEHQATRLHYDFRLELGGVLKSWAVPKGVPEDPGVKHLAAQTEDHPVDYIDFKGEIPKGEYGAGTVKVWDKGTYELTPENKGISKGELQFILKGQKLKGRYVMIHTPWKKGNEWLIFKIKK
ncbi:MAG: 3'-phosphoesterase [Candidatus Aenigmarchaeota archaeon]|nr:3'-phosphoesterase [Candidatus Aenigmarchaeota archaeon]